MAEAILTQVQAQAAESRQERGLSIPWDLGEWADKELLLKWIEQSVGELDWFNPELVTHLNHHPQYRPRELLILLSYGYATSLFESERLQDACLTDACARRIAGKHEITTRQIVQFRRENQGLLKWVLAEVLKKVVRHKFNLDQRLIPPGLRRFLQDNAIERVNLARHFDRGT